jgi:hypothetical protein
MLFSLETTFNVWVLSLSLRLLSRTHGATARFYGKYRDPGPKHRAGFSAPSIELELDAAPATNAPSQQRGSKLAVDALVDVILAEVSARGSDPSLLRILRLRVVAAVMLEKRTVLLNVGAECATVRDCTARVLNDPRPLASQILLAVAGIIKGGKPDPKGVLALVDRGGERSSTTLRMCLRRAVHRALVEDRVRKLGQHAWVLQLISIVVNDMPIGRASGG